MKPKITYFFAAFFILLILFKGIGSALPVVHAIWDNEDNLELVAESATETQQKKAGRMLETSPTEELFDHLFTHFYPAALHPPGKIHTAYSETYFPATWPEVQTPPPDQTGFTI